MLYLIVILHSRLWCVSFTEPKRSRAIEGRELYMIRTLTSGQVRQSDSVYFNVIRHVPEEVALVQPTKDFQGFVFKIQMNFMEK